MLCLKDLLIVNDTIYLKLLTVGVFRWNKLPGCWQLKDKKNSPLTIKNHLLEHNKVTTVYIYIYIYIYIYSRFLLHFRDRQMRYLTSAAFQCFSTFAGGALVLRDISFLILLSSLWTWDIFSFLTLKTSIFTKDSSGNKHSRLANQSQIFTYSSTTGQPFKGSDLRLLEEYHLHVSDCNWSLKQTTI